MVKGYIVGWPQSLLTLLEKKEKSSLRSLEITRFFELHMLLRKGRVMAQCRAYQSVFRTTQVLRDMLQKVNHDPVHFGHTLHLSPHRPH